MKHRLKGVARVLSWAGFALLVLCLVIAARALYAFRDRHPGYQLNVSISPSAPSTQPLRAGFGRASINPDLSNGSEPIWIAGFSQHRAATKIHDDLWSIACVLDDGRTRLGMVALDAIGFFQDHVIQVRKAVPAELKLDFIVITSTHNHNTPDLLGLWGPNYFRTGVNARYRQHVIDGCVRALEEAVGALQPAQAAFHEIELSPDGLVADTRKPKVFDPNIRLMHVTDTSDGRTLGTLVGWANHPETVWSRNTEITADFPGYLREAITSGVRSNGVELARGVGGQTLYINGAVGGLMSTTPGVEVHDPFTGDKFKEPTHAKARALGHALAARILPVLTNTHADRIADLPIGVRARTITVPLANPAYLAAGVIGLLDRGYVGWKKLRTEVALITLGPASIACVPGEIYPEIVNGGIDHVSGRDYEIDPLEVPPLRELMPGKIKFVFGLANDEIGYLIPKSQWDQKPPYAYGAKKAVYGEINSVGPEAAPLIHAAIRELCR
jgi:hypothetical protein